MGEASIKRTQLDIRAEPVHLSIRREFKSMPGQMGTADALIPLATAPTLKAPCLRHSLYTMFSMGVESNIPVLPAGALAFSYM